VATPIIHILEATDYDAEVSRGISALNTGELVVLPTETVYGAAGLLTNVDARRRLRALREGGDGKPFTIHLARREDARKYLGSISEFGHRLMKKLWPGPVGLVFEVSDARRAEVAGELGIPEWEIYEGSTITLRCPDHFLTGEILAAVSGPVGLTIAGQSATGPNMNLESLASELEGRVSLIYDAGLTRYSKPSTLLKVNSNGYEIVRAGVYDERIIERLLKTTILFVCSGNTCRSPMAEALARSLIAKRLHISESDFDKKGINIVSAGSAAMTGARATPAAVEAIRELGADLSRHRSRPLTIELIHQADWVFTMGQSHGYAVRALVPSASDKVMTLNPDGEIDDPIGSDLGVYKELAGELQKLVQRRLEEKAVI
jgi:protein-tyrosine phosphatase